MQKVETKFKKLIQQLDYSKVKLSHINLTEMRAWCYKHMPSVVEELVDLGWDIEDRDTWLEVMFINFCLTWYGKNILLYVTNSYVTYLKAKEVLQTKTFEKFVKEFNIDCHSVILVDSVIFLKEENLDDIFLSFDFNKKHSFLDFSFYDEDGNILEEAKEEWGWLAEDGDSSLVDNSQDPDNYYDVELWDAYKVKKLEEAQIYRA